MYEKKNATSPPKLDGYICMRNAVQSKAGKSGKEWLLPSSRCAYSTKPVLTASHLFALGIFIVLTTQAVQR